MLPASARSGLVHPEIKYKKLQSWYNMYQECGFLYLISGCTGQVLWRAHTKQGKPTKDLRVCGWDKGCSVAQ
eukprot:2008999-Rhodomonas_salina.1